MKFMTFCAALVSTLSLSHALAQRGGHEAIGFPPPLSESTALYMAFDVPEVNVTPAGLVGTIVFEKSLVGSVSLQKRQGRFECTKATPVVPNPSSLYACSLR
jgi:hypothetical protein